MSLLKARQRTAEAMADGAGSPIYHCLLCRIPTPHEDLRTYGARCRACFKAYCEAPQPSQTLYTGRRPGDAPRQFTMPEEP
jgi:hypothetical protein